MKVQNMLSASGNKVANQFIIKSTSSNGHVEQTNFQSYDTMIVKISTVNNGRIRCVELDREKWNYSRTTAKYRNQFLSETTKETQAKIDSGEYILTDLN